MPVSLSLFASLIVLLFLELHHQNYAIPIATYECVPFKRFHRPVLIFCGNNCLVIAMSMRMIFLANMALTYVKSAIAPGLDLVKTFRCLYASSLAHQKLPRKYGCLCSRTDYRNPQPARWNYPKWFLCINFSNRKLAYLSFHLIVSSFGLLGHNSCICKYQPVLPWSI